MFGNLAALTARQDDSNEPREPPPPATPLDFPRCKPFKSSIPVCGTSNDLAKLFNSTLKTGPTLKHLQALNISLANELPIEQVVPTGFIPEPSRLEASTKCDLSQPAQSAISKSASLSNGAQAPSREDFLNRVKELLYENEDAFRAIQRKPPPPNRQPAHVVYFRKFWDGLYSMAEYWDTSLDKYLDNSNEDQSAMELDGPQLKSTKAEVKNETNQGKDLKKTYTGRRRGTGRDMPGKYREDTVFSLVETLTWAFRCKLDQPHSQQRLKLQGTMIPILHAASVCRLPKDVREAKRGVVEGPMLGVFCRDQVSFRDLEEAIGEGKQEMMDMLRETGVMLMLAQKRAREGKEEEVPGKGQWWASAPRWGGGVGGELEAADEETMGDATASGSSRRQNKKTRGLDAWRSMQPPPGIWEKGVRYQQIGRDKGSMYDDIYLVSSINHHISILHLRIHQKYLDYLEQTPSQSKICNATQQPWYILEMKRSTWFDLFVPSDRAEAMRGIWAILGWQMRDMTDMEGRIQD